MTLVPKLLITAVLLLCTSIYAKIVTTGASWPYPKWRLALIWPFYALIARIELFFAGVFWIKYEKVKYDYSKYLGPDWKPSFKNPTTIIFNHSCYMDIVIAVLYKFPGFVAKDGVKNWPFIAPIG